MNKSQMAKLAAAAGVNGLMYDPNAEGVFGNVQGYTVTIMPNANNRVYYMLSLSVSRMGMAPNPADFKPLEKMNKVLSGCTVQRFRVNFLVKLSGNKDKMARPCAVRLIRSSRFSEQTGIQTAASIAVARRRRCLHRLRQRVPFV